MSADEDTELRDLVAQTLETNGVLGKIRVSTIIYIENPYFVPVVDAFLVYKVATDLLFVFVPAATCL